MRLQPVLLGVFATLALPLLGAAVGHAQVESLETGAEDAPQADVVGTTVWLDRDEEHVLRRGDRVKIYYRVEEDAFVTIFHIDTDGNVQLVLPTSPLQNNYVRGGRDYRVLLPDSPLWLVDDTPGMGYFFVVASLDPFDLSDIPFHHGAGWDLALVSRQVHGDPYEAMDAYIEAILPDWQDVTFGLDFVSYSVGARHDFPRFMCYECHAFRAYDDWNPYRAVCSDFRVVIWDDPYFYPSVRYGARGVVVHRPRRTGPRFEFKEASAAGVGEPVRRRRAVASSGHGSATPSGQALAPSRRPETGARDRVPNRSETGTEVDRSRSRGGILGTGSARRNGVQNRDLSRSGFRRPPLRLVPGNTGVAPRSERTDRRRTQPGSGASVAPPRTRTPSGSIVPRSTVRPDRRPDRAQPSSPRSAPQRPAVVPSRGRSGGARVAPSGRGATTRSAPPRAQRPPPRVRSARPKKKPPGSGV